MPDFLPNDEDSVYTLAVRRQFAARHALIGGDWGKENLPHSHQYLLELQIEGRELDEHGFLVDIVAVEGELDAAIDRFRGQFLNELSEFAGLNPSLEHFARILASKLDEQLKKDESIDLKVVLWEDDVAWAAYRPRR